MIAYRVPDSRDRGYVMVVVLLLMAILLSAGMYGVRAMDSDLRATAAMRKSELLARAAEAGAAARLAQIAQSQDDARFALDTQSGSSAIQPTAWPVAGTFTLSADLDEATQYQVESQPLVALETPPAGVQIGAGGQTTVWEITSYAISSAGSTETVGEHAVKVGVKLWSRGGRNYDN